MRNPKFVILAEVAIAIALSVALNFVAMRLPINIAGGSVSLTMLPIAVLALRRGAGAGALAGLVFGFLDLMMEPTIIHWAQVLLDYPVPYVLFGAGVGAFSALFNKAMSENKVAFAIAILVFAILIGGILRYAAHVASGVIFFADYAPVGESAIIYSLVYNISYLLPSLVGSGVLAAIILPVLTKVVPARKAQVAQ
jgi:thiamine transporter